MCYFAYIRANDLNFRNNYITIFVMVPYLKTDIIWCLLIFFDPKKTTIKRKNDFISLAQM